MRSVERRLQRIEASLPRKPEPRPVTDMNIQFSDTLACLLKTMEPDHVKLLTRELKASAKARERGIELELSELLFATCKCVMRHLKEKTPLAMPAEVAAVYISNSDLDWEACADCGYEVPVAKGRPCADPPRPEITYFAHCPLCGGELNSIRFAYNQSLKWAEAAGESQVEER
jgi:hypothetical protein